MTGAYHDSLPERLDEQYAEPPRPPRHKCGHPRCDTKVPLDKLACHRHWKMLPAPTRRIILEAWYAGGITTDAYHQATARAITWWEKHSA